MNDKNLRKVIFENNEIIGQLLLSKQQVRIMYLATEFGGGITSSSLSEFTDGLIMHHTISLQNASTQLRKLYDKGYLIREKLPNKSGGFEFNYKSIFN